MSAVVSLPTVFLLIGAVLLMLVVMTLADKTNPRRGTTALFWGLVAADFLLDRPLSDVFGVAACHRLVGLSVIAMALIAGCRGLGAGHPRFPSVGSLTTLAGRFGNRLFVPALLIPLVTVIGTVGLTGSLVAGRPLLDPANPTVTALGLAVVVASLSAWLLLGGSPLAGVRESKRLLDSIGWAAMLPQLLAVLGGIFVAAGTGQSVKTLTLMVAPEGSRLAMVAVYCLGMAAFTMVMGNAFAAFPVMTAGIALPILIKQFGADPAPLVAIGMYSGYCGTLMTPMAANFNMVPAALLNLKDRYGVIRAQVPTALPLLAVNILLMYLLAFR
jgi:uncharacterized membrane protein